MHQTSDLLIVGQNLNVNLLIAIDCPRYRIFQELVHRK